MTRRTTTIERCRPAQLKALLALGASPCAEGPELPVQVPKSAELSRLLTELFENDSAGGELLLATVTARTASLTELRLVKDLAKGPLGRAPTPAHRDAATLLYHAAVAAAYADHGVNLSKQALAPRWPLYEATPRPNGSRVTRSRWSFSERWVGRCKTSVQ